MSRNAETIKLAPLYVQHNYAVTHGTPCTCGCGLNTSAPEVELGTIVYAQWAVGPAQRGSGWLDPRTAPKLEAWTINHVWAFGYHVEVPGGGSISITRDQFTLEAPLTCCDGTGWTGNPRERCTTHFEAPDAIMYGH